MILPVVCVAPIYVLFFSSLIMAYMLHLSSHYDGMFPFFLESAQRRYIVSVVLIWLMLGSSVFIVTVNRS